MGATEPRGDTWARGCRFGWRVAAPGGGWREYFRVSGLGNREPGSGVQVRVQVQGLNFVPHPYLYLITRTCDLRAETWDLRMKLQALS